LHHGRRDDHGLSGRTALLVAKDNGTFVSGRLGEIRGAGGLCWIQPDVLPAVFARVHGDASKVLRIPGRVSGVTRDVFGGGFDSWSGLFDSDGLLLLVDAVRASRAVKSVGRVWARVENVISAAHREFQKDAGRYLGSIRIPPDRRSGGNRR